MDEHSAGLETNTYWETIEATPDYHTFIHSADMWMK